MILILQKTVSLTTAEQMYHFGDKMYQRMQGFVPPSAKECTILLRKQTSYIIKTHTTVYDIDYIGGFYIVSLSKSVNRQAKIIFNSKKGKIRKNLLIFIDIKILEINIQNTVSKESIDLEEVREASYLRIDIVMNHLDKLIGDTIHVYQNKRSVADAYAFVMALWSEKTLKTWEAYPNIKRFIESMYQDEAVKNVLKLSK